MSLTNKLEHQPNFPHEDLSEANTLWLSLGLGNNDIVTYVHTHVHTEYHFRIFRATHLPLTMAARNLYESQSTVSAINFGIKALEVMTMLVHANDLEPNLVVLENNINGIVDARNTRTVSSYFEEAQESFIRETPRTAQVIYESSQRHNDPRLAVLGGAIARQFSIHNTGEE